MPNAKKRGKKPDPNLPKRVTQGKASQIKRSAHSAEAAFMQGQTEGYRRTDNGL